MVFKGPPLETAAHEKKHTKAMWRGQDLNLRPADYESAALPTALPRDLGPKVNTS